jgi:hypothetical protein
MFFLQVPSSLRLLQKLCKKADVPLFVVHDPRAWGGNTQATLEEALAEMRSTVKNRVISNALKQQGSLAFTRGRMLGQAETEAKWQLKDKKQRAKEMLGLDRKKRRREKEDWSEYDTTMLEKKLMSRRVITKVDDIDDPDKKSYSPAMLEIAKRCVDDQIKMQQASSSTVEADNSSDQTVDSSSETVTM